MPILKQKLTVVAGYQPNFTSFYRHYGTFFITKVEIKNGESAYLNIWNKAQGYEIVEGQEIQLLMINFTTQPDQTEHYNNLIKL